MNYVRVFTTSIFFMSIICLNQLNFSNGILYRNRQELKHMLHANGIFVQFVICMKHMFVSILTKFEQSYVWQVCVLYESKLELKESEG